jgi:tetratricopeptide (TPR) repeat protein
MLIDLFQATNQPGRAEPYRRQRQMAADLETLRWQTDALAGLATNSFELYRLFDLRLKLSDQLYEAGRYVEGYSYAEQALMMAESWNDKLREASASNLAGLNLDGSRNYPAARPYYERALAIQEKVLGPEHPDTAVSLWWLGIQAARSGDIEQAQQQLQRALSIFEAKLGREHPHTQALRRSMAGLGGSTDG